MCGIDLPVLFVAACCWALTILITISEGSSRWASSWSTSLPELEADDCKHRRAGGWYNLWEFNERDCYDKDTTKFRSGDTDYVNYPAFELNRWTINILLAVCTACAIYYAITGCCGRVRCVEKICAFAMLIAGAGGVSGAGYWFYRFNRRPYDDEFNDDRNICDLGCQYEVACGGAAIVLGFIMLCLSNGDGFGGPMGAEDASGMELSGFKRRAAVDEVFEPDFDEEAGILERPISIACIPKSSI